MRVWITIGIMFGVATSALGQKTVTVQELTQSVMSLQHDGKSDDEVAASLQQTQLSEEITASDAARLERYLPGPASREQLAVLRGLSAFAPAPAVTSAPPAPDAAAQSAILARTGAWVTAAITQAPSFSATRVEFHYQENAQGTNSAAGSLPEQPQTYHSSSDEETDNVEISQGIDREIDPAAKVNWGENGKISDGGPIPSLPDIFANATASGKLAFSRWETVDGKPAAVFSFAIEKKKLRYPVDYCCFPIPDTVVADQYPNGEAMITPGASARVTRWRPFRKDVPYHGLIYIDPQTGAILRTITMAELKPFDFVRVEESRTDYGTATLAGKSQVVPVRRVRFNETVPGGDTRPFSYPIRRTLLTIEYANYRAGTK